MINAQGKHVAYSGGKPYVLVKEGKKLIQIPIDPANQQFACEIKTTFYNQYIGGLIDKRYRRRGLDDRSYFLNVLTARSNPTMQGFMLLGKSICLFTPIYNFIDQGKWWDWEDVVTAIVLWLCWKWLDKERDKILQNDLENWRMKIYHNGLQSLINDIQEKGW